jgi:hypothetical protein
VIDVGSGNLWLISLVPDVRQDYTPRTDDHAVAVAEPLLIVLANLLATESANDRGNVYLRCSIWAGYLLA